MLGNMKNNIPRDVENLINSYLFNGKIIVLYGARQVGKTTLVKKISAKFKDNLFFNCDELDIREMLTHKTSTELKNIIGNNKLVIIDEAQRVTDIGITLKLLIDNFPEIQIIATGSSSFDLANKISEPLTGRKILFQLFPFSVNELRDEYTELELKRILHSRIIFGMYPDVVKAGHIKNVEILKELTNSYLYKDILIFQNIKNPEAIEKLLQLLALQIGNEVSYTELASELDIDKNTISKYIQILEKAFVIFRLNPFSRNLRNELKKMRKIYFVDTGVRNALINNFNPLELRNDKGALWENFVISERMKYNAAKRNFCNTYFWRTHAQQEIDYIEEYGGKLHAYECKFSDKKRKHKIPKKFLETYPDSICQFVTPDNFFDFV